MRQLCFAVDAFSKVAIIYVKARLAHKGVTATAASDTLFSVAQQQAS